MTMKMIIQLCKRIISEFQLTSLGVFLELEDHTIKAILHDYRSISEAAFEMLTLWRRRTKSDKEAFQVLKKALIDMNELRIVKDVLQGEQ